MPVQAVKDTDREYDEVLRALSEASVNRNFDPYVDIDWEAAEFAVTANDERWILNTTSDPLGRHPWYQALPRDKKIAIGMWRQANVAKVGLQFEQLLMGGVLNHVFRLENGSAEFRYCTHEVIEECNHTLMFQEMVNRIGIDVPGGTTAFKVLAPWLALAGKFLPEVFFTGILAGEEPIDHLQKGVLRSGENIHPIMHGVMRIHVAEEARHISFAHKFLGNRVPKMSRPGRVALSIVFPVTMRVLCDVIVIPPKQFWDEFDIPKSVKKDLFWRLPESREQLSDYFADVRTLAEEIGLMNPVSRPIWKLLKIDGKPSRYRSEPNRAPVMSAA
ncbi:MAG: AurF N-oxygenase family protein [Jatrophihabitans sp.]